MAFNLQDYETVEERLIKFWKDHPDGRIETELIEASSNRFIMVARVFRTEADSRYWTAGHAYEIITDRGVNSTSALENCETSAIGRALANANYATRGKRPSREEMSKVQNFTKERPTSIQVENPEDAWTVKTTSEPRSLLLDIAEAFGSTEEIPHCKHGEMKRKEGTSKTGKAYMGYVCVGYLATGGDPQCPAVWYELTPSGKWKPQEKK